MIIGITGKAGAGKDTVANMIHYYFATRRDDGFAPLEKFLEDYLQHYYRAEYFQGWKIKKFAKKLKQISAILLGCEESDFESQEFKNKEISPLFKLGSVTYRWFLQKVGTDCFRDIIHQDFWVNCLIADYDENEDNWIISDVRFTNEAAAIDGFIIKVVRDIPGATDAHQSETEIDSIVADYIIQNNGTISELYENVKKIIDDRFFN